MFDIKKLDDLINSCCEILNQNIKDGNSIDLKSERIKALSDLLSSRALFPNS